ncbi:MAG: hypothetical protein OFPI_09580 [Osedax symbiont Rs2]|nr:MAG: hypothetical protein OFPI_09580 [Osedax symbiont Rs2]
MRTFVRLAANDISCSMTPNLYQKASFTPLEKFHLKPKTTTCVVST